MLMEEISPWKEENDKDNALKTGLAVAVHQPPICNILLHYLYRFPDGPALAPA
jgi:hypothetical protein